MAACSLFESIQASHLIQIQPSCRNFYIIKFLDFEKEGMSKC